MNLLFFHPLPPFKVVLPRLCCKGRLDELIALPNIEWALQQSLVNMSPTGKSTLLDDLAAKESSAAVFARVPGIGQELAQRIADQLGIKTLSELEQAAHDGRLAQVEGFGQKRIEGIKASIAGMLSAPARSAQQERQPDGRSVNQ